MTFPENEDGPPPKKLKLDDAVKESEAGASEEKNLLNFCDDILLEIFYYLKPIDLYSLSQCCQRLQRVVCDRTLWEDVDLRKPRLKRREIEAFVDFLLPSTKSLATRGTWNPSPGTWDGETELRDPGLTEDEYPTISEKILLLTAIKSPNLTCFVFENHVFDCEDIKFNEVIMYADGEHLPIINDNHQHNTRNRNLYSLPTHHLSLYKKKPSHSGRKLFNHLPRDIQTKTGRSLNTALNEWLLRNPFYSLEEFLRITLIWGKLPSGLEELAMRSCHLSKCQKHKAFFSGIYDCLPNLKKLDLSGCKWFQPHSFLALSKCKRLEELRVADCHLSDFVPYVSLGTRFGFQALTILDLRRTWVSDREVSCFDKTTTLRELYLESPGGRRGPYLISDLAVTSFGGTVDEWNNMGYIVMFMEHFEGFKPSSLSVIELCNYKSVTDTSLRHCASCLKGLTRLNVTGTSCSLEAVMDFKAKRPDVNITSNFDSDLVVDSGSNEENN